MARRRFQRSRFSPDRGWIVGDTRQAFPASAGVGAPAAFYHEIFDFTDVDADALTGAIQQDKSDWFVRRVILDVFASISFTGTGATDVARLYQLGMGIMPDAEAVGIPNTDPAVLSPDGYNNWARLFQTWVKPVYAGGLLPYTSSDSLATSVGAAAQFSTTAPFWGEAGWHADFEVSNAGLRNDQSCGFHVSLQDGPSSGFDWDFGDILYLNFAYRILMQKRRT